MTQLRLSTSIVLLFVFFACSETKPNRRETRCQAIPRGSTCSDMGYDHTLFPNALGHESTDEAGGALDIALTGLASVIGTGDQCYNLIRTFMCNSHVPMCVVKSSTALPPCREMCELLFSQCGNIMQTIPQLASINCEMVPYYNGDISTPNCAPVSPFVEEATGSTDHCELLTVPSCSHMPYNFIDITNTTQDQIEAQMRNYIPLIQLGCSPALTNLFCSIHAPPCGVEGIPMYPCREMCEAAIDGCTVLEQAPPDQSLQCNLFPPRSSGICFYMDVDTSTAGSQESAGSTEHCELLTVPSCSHMPYNFTDITNTTQDQIEEQMRNYIPLIQLGCSPALTNLFCSMHAPPCGVEGIPMYPCRELCEAALDGCPVLEQAPPGQSLQCDIFPPRSSGICFYMETDVDISTTADECEPLEVTACRGFGYTHTAFPNYLLQQSQAEAESFAAIFATFEGVGECGEMLVGFLCQILAPRCVGDPMRKVPPCKRQCERTRDVCLDVLRTMDMESILDCELLDVYGSYCEDDEIEDGPEESAGSTEHCELLTVPSCSHMPYNFTLITNTTQDHIEAQMQNYIPIIQLGCSPALINLFCSIYAPPCSVVGIPIYPCRELCEAAIDGCTVLEQAPPDQSLQCDIFPPKSAGICFYMETDVDISTTESSNAAQPPLVLKKRRYDITEQGTPSKFRGWADVQGQGAANDYCRVLRLKKKRFYLACALAGSDDEEGYTSPEIQSGDFDQGYRNTWYMKDEDGDGRDDFCRCVGNNDTYVSCMRAGETGFEGNYDFTPTGSPRNCKNIVVNPFLGHPQANN